jgi:hypothetical protein
MHKKEYRKIISHSTKFEFMSMEFTEAYDFEYKPEEKITKYIRFWFPEQSQQFEDLLNEAGYKNIS